jgi:hypothetical protein
MYERLHSSVLIVNNISTVDKLQVVNFIQACSYENRSKHYVLGLC